MSALSRFSEIELYFCLFWIDKIPTTTGKGGCLFVYRNMCNIMPLFTGMTRYKTTLFYSSCKAKHLTGNHESVVKVIFFFLLVSRDGCEPQNFVRFRQNSYVKVQMLTLSKSKYLEAGNLYKNIFPLDLSNTMSSARLHPGEFWPTMQCVCALSAYTQPRGYF